MFANKKRWFAMAGICMGAGIVLMVASFLLAGCDPWKLQSPLPVGVSIVHDGVHIASDGLPAAPEAPQPPKAPSASAAFDAADKLDLAGRALAQVLDLAM